MNIESSDDENAQGAETPVTARWKGLPSDERVLSLADNLPGFIYLCLNDEHYTILYQSEPAEQILGYPRKAFLSGEVQFASLIHPDDLDTVVQTVNSAMQARTSFHLVYRVRHSAGHYIWIEERGSGNYNGDKLESLQGFIADVTGQVRQKRESEVLVTLGQHLAVANTMDKLGEALVSAVSAFWSWDALLFSIRQSGEGRLRAVVEIDTIDGVKIQYPSNTYDTILPVALRSRKPVLKLRDEADIPVTPDRFGDRARPSMSLMYVPVFVTEKGLGLLSVQSYTPRLYDESDLALLHRIAEAAAPVAERCRAEERNHAFSLLGEKLSSVSTSEEAAAVIVEVADQLIGWDACAMYIYSEQTNTVAAMIAYDVMDSKRTKLPPGEETRPGETLLRTVREGQILILREPDVPFDESIPLFGNTALRSASLLWVTLRTSSGVPGVLTIQSYSWKAYDNDDLQLLQALADHCSSALERVRAQQALAEEKERYRHAISSAGAVPYELNYDTKRYSFIGEGIESVTGYPAADFTPALWKSLVQEVLFYGDHHSESPQEVVKKVHEGSLPGWKADVRITTRGGETRWVADTSIEKRDERGRPFGSLGILQDITERKCAEQKFLHDAMHDPLTGLANRALLLDHLQQAFHRTKRRDTTYFAILFIDLDRFKNVNDSLGHMLGDQLLVAMAQRLQQCVRPDDTVSRFAGDEFVILLDDMKNPEDIIPVTERILSETALPIKLDSHEVVITVSIGIAFSAPYYTGPEELLRDADTALYRSKARGRGRYEIFDAGMRQQAISVLALENDLRRALDRKELLLHYQPIVDLASGKICRLEALLRWHHPTRGFVPPDEIIPLAEETGLIIPLGYWVMEEAIRQLAEWQATFPGLSQLGVAVNLSVRQLDAPDLLQRTRNLLQQSSVPPGCFRFEITESAFLEKSERNTDILARLKAEGIGLSLDDFGTGYSSLSYLHRLPIDTVKIDRSFISQIQVQGPGRQIVRTIIQLADNLGFSTTAEGIETAEQLSFAREMGCTRGQGYFFSKPLPPTAAAELLATGKAW